MGDTRPSSGPAARSASTRVAARSRERQPAARAPLLNADAVARLWVPVESTIAIWYGPTVAIVPIMPFAVSEPGGQLNGVSNSANGRTPG